MAPRITGTASRPSSLKVKMSSQLHHALALHSCFCYWNLGQFASKNCKQPFFCALTTSVGGNFEDQKAPGQHADHSRFQFQVKTRTSEPPPVEQLPVFLPHTMCRDLHEFGSLFSCKHPKSGVFILNWTSLHSAECQVNFQFHCKQEK